jgi:hypothetical protein
MLITLEATYTSGGHEVRVHAIDLDADPNYPVLATIRTAEGWDYDTFTAAGCFLAGEPDGPKNLVRVEAQPETTKPAEPETPTDDSGWHYFAGLAMQAIIARGPDISGGRGSSDELREQTAREAHLYADAMTAGSKKGDAS